MAHVTIGLDSGKLPVSRVGGRHPKDVGALADAYIPANFVEPSALLQFLKDSANPPVAIGFGSMPFFGSVGLGAGDGGK